MSEYEKKVLRIVEERKRLFNVIVGEAKRDYLNAMSQHKQKRKWERRYCKLLNILNNITFINFI